MTQRSVTNLGQQPVIPVVEFCPQLGAPLVQLPKELLELLATSLTAKDLVSLGGSCQLLQPVFNASRRWISLFQRTFPYHLLNPEISASEQFKQRHLTQRNWVQNQPKVTTCDKMIVQNTPLAFFQNFVLANGEGDTIVAYERNTMKKLYEFAHNLALHGWYDGGDVFISSNIDKRSQAYRARVWEKNTGNHMCWIEGGTDLVADKDSIFGTKTRIGAGIENDTQLVAWDKNTGEVKFAFASSESSVSPVLHQDRFFAIVNDKVLAWQTTDGSLIGTFEGGGQVRSFVVTDNMMISSHTNNELRIWSKDDYQCTHILKTTTSYHTLAVHGTLLSGFGNLLIEMWDIKDRLMLHSQTISLYFFDRDKFYSVSKGEGNIIIRTGLPQLEFQLLAPNCAQIEKLIVSDRRLFALTSQNRLHAWDMVTKKLFLSLDRIYEFHVEDDCIFALTGNYDFDRILKVWDFRHLSI
ncbi:MAG TPA: hypothetical protein VFU89_08420 [Rhabdochlamydiaceae bacterium]|nr:hypothetical protein [Rhabdochlamydiaceae bacterium]